MNRLRWVIALLLLGIAQNVAMADPSNQPYRHAQFLLPDPFELTPAAVTEPISEGSLQWPLMLRNFYWYEADQAYVRELADAHLEDLFDAIRPFEDESGFLKGLGTEWPEALTRGYDYATAKVAGGAILNAFYYASLTNAAGLQNDLGQNGAYYEQKAARLKAAYLSKLYNPNLKVVRDAPGSESYSLQATAVAISFGLIPREETTTKARSFLRKHKLNCPIEFAPYVIEACFLIGETDLAYELLEELGYTAWPTLTRKAEADCANTWTDTENFSLNWCAPWNNSPMYLIGQYVMGVRPSAPGWSRVAINPRVYNKVAKGALRVSIPSGHISVEYLKDTGLKVTTPTLMESVIVGSPEGYPVVAKQSISHEHATLQDTHKKILDAAGWAEEVGDKTGVWVSVKEQTLRIITNGNIDYQAGCATAKNGTGSEMDSLKTPLGWHSIERKIGDDAPWGQVFRGRVATSQIWKPGDDVIEDMVLTRLLHLTGEEPGKNRGGRLDSYNRAIYIHGTNDEDNIGTPTSHGCVRLLNDEVIDVYNILDKGTMVLITQD